MKVKVRKHKKVPAPVVSEQAKRTTIEYLKDSVKCYGIPKEVLVDDYKPVTSKSN